MNPNGMQTVHVSAVLVLAALTGLILLNRVTLNVAVGR